MLGLARVVAILALAGCPLQKSGGTTMVGGPGGGTPSGGGGGDNATASGEGNVTVPNLMGKTPNEALALVKAAGFQYEAGTQARCDGPEGAEVGKIDCQDPEPGKSVQKYTMVSFRVKEGERLTGMFLRRHFDKLQGMPVEQAKAQAKKDGHTGQIRVEEADRFVKGCKENTVCEASDERGGQSGMDSKDLLILLTNKTLTIAPPPD